MVNVQELSGRSLAVVLFTVDKDGEDQFASRRVPHDTKMAVCTWTGPKEEYRFVFLTRPTSG